MLNRRQTLSLLALGSSAAATTTPLHAQSDGAAPAPQPADAAQPIPPFSRAALGDAVPPGWMHQRLPKVERANTFAIVQEGPIDAFRAGDLVNVTNDGSTTRVSRR